MSNDFALARTIGEAILLDASIIFARGKAREVIIKYIQTTHHDAHASPKVLAKLVHAYLKRPASPGGKARVFKKYALPSPTAPAPTAPPSAPTCVPLLTAHTRHSIIWTLGLTGQFSFLTRRIER